MFRDTFYGKTISNYGRQYGRVDYRTLASTFDAVLCNGILNYKDGWDDWEQVSGWIDRTEELNEYKAELEEIIERLEEAREEKRKAENDYDDLCDIYNNVSDLLERFNNFEHEANEILETLQWNNFETPNGDDLDGGTLEDNINCVDFWGMREAIEDHESTAEEQRDESEERFDELNEEVENLEKRKAELEELIEEAEAEEEEQQEVYQWYIISDNGAQIIQENAPSEVLYHNDELDIYVWGVTHWGTSWDYVLTSIPCETYEQTKEREKKEASEAFRAEMQSEYDRIKAENDAQALADYLDALTVEAVEEAPTEDETESKTPSDLLVFLGSLSNEELEELDPYEPTHTTERRGQSVYAYMSEEEPNTSEKAKALDAWTVFTDVETAIKAEVERIEHDNDYFYAKECERLMKHCFEIGDTVINEDGYWRVVGFCKADDSLLLGRGELDRAEVNRFDVFGLSSEGEQVRTPCTAEELAVLKANCVWR